MTSLVLILQVLAAALLGHGHSAVPTLPVATPIGRGPRFALHTGARADRAAPIGRLRCTSAAGRWEDAHLEVFAQGRVVIIPPGVGIARPRVQVGAAVSGGRCSYPMRTTDPTGVIRFRPGRGLTLGDVFAVWGQPLAGHRLCGFASAGAVRVYVGGRRFRGAPARALLRRHEEIVVEIGPRVPPHASYVFANGRAATA
jgi:hypothetical protein